jgi:hypothetical protein
MLTLKDCIALCDLSEEEVDAIAEHEHIPTIIAAEMANYLCHSPAGVPMIRHFIVDDIRNAENRGDTRHAQLLKLVLWHFIQTHPDNQTALKKA